MMQPVSKASGPLYIQLKESLAGQIQAGRYGVHERLPSERELAGQFHVSRMTVRQALQTLAHEGAIYTRLGKGTFVAAQQAEHTAADRHRENAAVHTGLEVLLSEGAARLTGRQAGLISHPAAVMPDLTASAVALRRAGVDLVALFGMEHGFGGAAADGAAVGHAADPLTGLPVFSLYGATLEPTAEMLAGIEVLIYDVQDVGVRYYTFISTLFYALRACGRSGIPLVVLDRPNPINGLDVEGPSIEAGYTSFVGIVPMPIRHGLTAGELAGYLNQTYGLGAGLEVIAMEGWRREMWFDDTGLPWVPTSPGIPHLSTAVVYPGACLLEGTTLSEGRGTALPFEVAGAPWLNPYDLADALNGLDLAGARFRPTYFEPCASKQAGQTCAGVQIHVTDRSALRPVALGLHLIAACRSQSPGDFAFLPSSWEGRRPHFDLLAGGSALRNGLATGTPVPELTATWAGAADRFRQERAPYLLYPEAP